MVAANALNWWIFDATGHSAVPLHVGVLVGVLQLGPGPRCASYGECSVGRALCHITASAGVEVAAAGGKLASARGERERKCQ